MKNFYRVDKNKLFKKINKIISSKDKSVQRYSIIRELKQSERINNDFLFYLDNLSLEDIISVKLELSFKSFKSRLVGLDFLDNLQELVEKSILQYALSISDTYRELAYIVGVTSLAALQGKLRKFNLIGKDSEREE